MNKKEELQDRIKIQKYLVDLYTIQLDDAKADLEKAQEELEDLEMKDFEPTPKGWKPKIGEKYWIAHYNLNPTTFLYDDENFSRNIFKYNRIFKTKGECQLYCDIQRAFRDASREFNGGKDNWEVLCDRATGEIRIINYSYAQDTNLYFDRKKIAQNLIDRFGEENVKRYYLGVY